jgi:hypothetical protein
MTLIEEQLAMRARVAAAKIAKTAEYAARRQARRANRVADRAAARAAKRAAALLKDFLLS